MSTSNQYTAAELELLRKIASKGGKNGTGAAKRRSPEHYAKMQAALAKARAKRRKEKRAADKVQH